jgi:hypothetical protein
MVDVRTLWQFDPRTARALRDFILHPSAGLHPDRLEQLQPGAGGWITPTPQGDAALSRALMRSLDLSDQVELDLDDPLHRSALLPAEGLSIWARTVEAMAMAPRLRRVILHSELQLLQPLLSQEQWSLALDDQTVSLARGVVDASVLSDQTVDALVDLFDNLGWRLIESAWSQLPRSVALRAGLKLPLREGPSLVDHTGPESARAIVKNAYAHAMEAWSPDWDRAWTLRMAA